MLMFHGANKAKQIFKKGAWVTDSIKTAQSFGKFIYVIDVVEDDIEWDILSTLDTKDNRGTLKRDYNKS